MNAVYDMLTAKRKALAAQQRASLAATRIKPKYEYDSDEETDGGTWEHRQRVMEMEATRGNHFSSKSPI